MRNEATCGHGLYWYNCYSGGFDLIAPDSYAHPAKMAPALCYRILDHLKETGLLKDSDTVLDPMGGTGMTAICAGAKGYKAITTELEEKFIGFQQQNKDYAARKLYRDLDWTILQGDARKLSELLNEKCVTVSSPPYAEAQSGGGIAVDGYQGTKHSPTDLVGKRSYMPETHGTTPGQIGNLKDTPLKAITSPPYDNAIHSGSGEWSKSPKGRLIGGDMSGGGKMIGIPQGKDYIKANGTISKEQGESYLEAMKRVYSEIALVSDVLCVVVKNPTRNGKLRRLDLDTIRILEMAGWTIHCQHRALLFEELEQGDMFNGSQKKIKGRMSFFKRLSWQNGQPVAAWEDVIIAVRRYDTPDKR